jgi:ParB/RepB/Spo0J family partition protein
MVVEEYTPKLSQFLARNARFITGEPKIVNGERVWQLKSDICADREKLDEIRTEAASFGVTFSLFPTPRFSVKITSEEENGKQDLYLHECDIEDGGPQPRTKIDPKDPKIQELYASLDKYGQLDPCKGYPSPTTPGKYRLRDGHCRRFIIFNMLRSDVLWVVSQKRTEKQCYKDAYILNNNRNNLTPYDLGHYIQEVLMKLFPIDYPNQTVVAKELGIDQALVSRYISTYIELEGQKKHLSSDVYDQVIANLSEHTIREVRKASDDLKAPILEQVAEKNLSVTETKHLVETANANPEMVPSEIAVEAQRIKEQKAEVRAQEYMLEADKISAKTERARDKVVACVEYPEDLMKAVFGVLGLKGKVNPEKAKSLASVAVALLIQKCVEKQIFAVDAEGQTHLYELGDLVREASTWQ